MNSFALIARYRQKAKAHGVARDIIEAVCKDAMSGDRAHLEEVLHREEARLEL